MKRLAGKSDPTADQVEKWTPEKMIPELLSVKGKDIVAQEASLLAVPAPTKIVGDIHGQFSDLVRLLECGGHPPDQTYIFLGDYVDRGNYGVECMMLLLCYKIAHPEKIFMLRGNHECR